MSRRDQLSSMSNAYAKHSCATIRYAESYTGRQYQPQYRKIDVWAHACT